MGEVSRHFIRLVTLQPHLFLYLGERLRRFYDQGIISDITDINMLITHDSYYVRMNVNVKAQVRTTQV